MSTIDLYGNYIIIIFITFLVMVKCVMEKQIDDAIRNNDIELAMKLSDLLAQREVS